MSDYFEIYAKRLNRNGRTYQERIQNQREKEFEHLLLRSIYRVDFEYDDVMYAGTFEKYKQDETKTLHYLLTPVNLNIPCGTVLMLKDKDGIEEPWMVYYLEHIIASGYNRYIMLKMTHWLEWTGRDGFRHSSWAYFYGQENNMLKDELKSRSRSDVLYTENLKLSFFVMPMNPNLSKEDYMEIKVGEDLYESYRVTGYDRVSTPGVAFVSVDPTYKRDLTEVKVTSENKDNDDMYWLKRGQHR